ncbi:MAG: hypothetical protein JWQ69_5943 [Pseudomonas sp.]|nr:hypothetical protein [Pseudomonas sp.]
MASRSKVLSALAFTIGCVVSLLLVLNVNNGLDLFEVGSGNNLGAPSIEVIVDDGCNSISYLAATVQVLPFQSKFTIQSYPTEHRTCARPQHALIDFVNLKVTMADNKMDARDWRYIDPRSDYSYGTIQRVAGAKSNEFLPLVGNGSEPEINFEFSPDALEVGYGETALQVLVATRDLTCPTAYLNPHLLSDFVAASKCLIPLQGALLYAGSAFDLASTTPPVDRLVVGPAVAPDVGRYARRDDEYYQTTRLVWSGRVKPPSNVIDGMSAGFEYHLLKRHSVALRLFVTVAFSAVFGTFISMLFGLFQQDRRSCAAQKIDEPAAQTPESAAPHVPPLTTFAVTDPVEKLSASISSSLSAAEPPATNQIQTGEEESKGQPSGEPKPASKRDDNTAKANEVPKST